MKISTTPVDQALQQSRGLQDSRRGAVRRRQVAPVAQLGVVLLPAVVAVVELPAGGVLLLEHGGLAGGRGGNGGSAAALWTRLTISLSHFLIG